MNYLLAAMFQTTCVEKGSSGLLFKRGLYPLQVPSEQLPLLPHGTQWGPGQEGHQSGGRSEPRFAQNDAAEVRCSHCTHIRNRLLVQSTKNATSELYLFQMTSHCFNLIG